MTTRPAVGDAGLPPESVCAYIEDMLGELAVLASKIGESELACTLDCAAVKANRANARRRDVRSESAA